ncbi:MULTISPECIES: hypothetical protein [Rhizobium]|uniref:EF-hand domain-containing protein n=1 Tax=Rhizobium bangladeshense TaxID=1138189 RepID=A0ABS7LIY5_9HYPH|nr:MULTISPECIES: hypothetical protein [Rhizobium]MBX4869832.1 hypothetical protein [Rhizobium bangladeshense]MBX4874631.1 hypothetical protein [Rhizobium bangladeshense]MBX4885659.1 hypothetical protein [Rhizobium bangladeshense]MBX4891077.1 hypothetical protein [Rhizobium bangladeshense]MBX4895163.1 hypothetical protein [Rhizobium bangladeshense]
MTRTTSVSDTSYAYLATLSRLDLNGDGVLSRGERAADEKPGIIKELLEEDVGSEAQPRFSGSLIALMMDTHDSSTTSSIAVPYPLQQAAPTSGSQSDDLYRNTYGQFDFEAA